MNTARISTLILSLALSISATLALQGCGGGGTTASTPPVVVTPPTPVPSIADALTELNRLRASAGVNPMVMDTQVTKAAENHAKYMASNKILSHLEDPLLIGFTGVTVKDRLATAGYTSYAEGEVASQSNQILNSGDNPVLALRIFFGLPYHGFALLNGHHDFGMGSAKIGNDTAFSIDFASKTINEHSLVQQNEVGR